MKSFFQNEVAQIFGINLDDAAPFGYHSDTTVPSSGIVYLTGYSGSGKSTLLRKTIAKLDHFTSPKPCTSEELKTPVIDLLKGTLQERLQVAGYFGLSEAKILVAEASVLSTGQAARLELALAVQRCTDVLVVDEFLANLDRTTAKIVAFRLAKYLRMKNLSAILCTAQDDLLEALDPDHHVVVGFGAVRTSARKAPVESCNEYQVGYSPVKVSVKTGSYSDYRNLSCYHYADSSKLRTETLTENCSFITAYSADEIVGVCAIAKPFSNAFEKMSWFREINNRSRIIMRTVIHPAFRGAGIPRMFSTHLEQSFNGALLRASAMGRFFPYPLASGYKEVAHPSQTKSLAQEQLEQFLVQTLNVDRIDFQNENALEKVIATLGNCDLLKLRSHVKDAFVDVQTRFCFFLAEVTETPKPKAQSLERLFSALFDRYSVEEFSLLITECVFFPMSAFFKKGCSRKSVSLF